MTTPLLKMLNFSDMMISFLSGWLAVTVFVALNRNVVEFVTWLVTTFVILIIGEITPKIYSRDHSQFVTWFAVPVLSKIETITKPFLFPVVKVLDFVFKNNDDEDE